MNKIGILGFIFMFLGSLVAVLAVKSNRVIGGDPVKLGDFPWQAAIYYEDIYVCGGSLISNKHILTSKHCLEPYEFYPNLLNVHMGVLVAADTKNKRQGSKIHLATPQSPLVMDVVAILEFDKEVEIGDGKEMMAITPQLTMDLKHLDHVKLSGWGMDDDTIYHYLHAADLRVEGISSVCAVDGSKPLCTFGVDLIGFDRIGPCKWDEGSGLVKYETALDDSVIVGVVKHTNTCSGATVKESKYIPVAPFVTWIDSIIGPTP